MPPSDPDRITVSTTAMPTTVVWLGYGGLIPFVSLAAVAGIGGAGALHGNDAWLAQEARALFAYGAVILSFVGALHWAFAMTLLDLPAPRRNAVFVWSVVPALLAWVALMLSPAAAAAVMIVGFLAQYRRDVALARVTDLPVWYLPLRLRLTTVACACLALGGFAGQGWIAAGQ